MKKTIFTIFMLLTLNSAYGMTSEFFDGMDENSVKAGISKYILTKGGNVYHGESYDSNTFQAAETKRTKSGTFTYIYLFNLTETEDGTRLDLTLSKLSASKPVQVSLEEEKNVLDNIKSSIKGRLLYGLGFDFEYYETDDGKIKAPKGHKDGITLTSVKYDAQKQGLMAGDVIVEINGVKTSDIPLKQFATILYAHDITDKINLTCKRGKDTFSVTLTPRQNNTRVF